MLKEKIVKWHLITDIEEMPGNYQENENKIQKKVGKGQREGCWSVTQKTKKKKHVYD